MSLEHDKRVGGEGAEGLAVALVGAAVVVCALIVALAVRPPTLGWLGFAIVSIIALGLAALVPVGFERTRVNCGSCGGHTRRMIRTGWRGRRPRLEGRHGQVQGRGEDRHRAWCGPDPPHLQAAAVHDAARVHHPASTSATCGCSSARRWRSGSLVPLSLRHQQRHRRLPGVRVQHAEAQERRSRTTWGCARSSRTARPRPGDRCSSRTRIPGACGNARRSPRSSAGFRCTCCSSLASRALLLASLRTTEPWVACAMGSMMIAIGIELTCYYYSFLFATTFLYSKRKEAGAILLGVTAATGLIDWAPTKYLPSTGSPRELPHLSVAGRAVHAHVRRHAARLRLDHVPVRAGRVGV